MRNVSALWSLCVEMWLGLGTYLVLAGSVWLVMETEVADVVALYGARPECEPV